MKIAITACILVVGAAGILWIGDNLSFLTLGSLLGDQLPLLILLLSIPISLSLFVFLSHRQSEQLKGETLEERPTPSEPESLNH